MAITAETRTEIIELVVAATNSAPGTALLTQLVSACDGGASLADIAATLTSTASSAEIAMIGMEIGSLRDRERSGDHCVELRCPDVMPDDIFKELGISRKISKFKGRNRKESRYWEGS